MNGFKQIVFAISTAAVAACGASRPPAELVDARAAYAKAEQSNAAKMTPAELHVAKVALDDAEREFDDDDDSQETKDLAYIAQRMAQRAVALGNAAAAGDAAASFADEKDKTQNDIIASQEGQLRATKGQLQKKQGELVEERQTTEAERQARLDAEQKAADAEKRAQESMAALAKSLAVKDDTRGTVITLSGGVLFATNKATILPGAQAQLNQVADALKTQAERHFTIEGHTDNQGTDALNNDLSLRRANAVREYLVVRGVSANAVSASGLGSTRPIGQNKTTEGRAMNRRVEIIVGAATPTAAR